jgi:hypothetical protein
MGGKPEHGSSKRSLLGRILHAELDRTSHPISAIATKVFFGCFLVGIGLLFHVNLAKRPWESPTFCILVVLEGFLTLCSVIAYFRPHGIPAFVVSTAYLSLFFVGGFYVAGTWLRSFPMGVRVFFSFLVAGLWLLWGMKVVRDAKAQAQD